MRYADTDRLRGAVCCLRRNWCYEFSGAVADAIDELDILRAQNAALVSAAQKQDQREHELMMERRELAKSLSRWGVETPEGYGGSGRKACLSCGRWVVLGHKLGCPVALAERVLAEPVANPRAISGDNAPDLAQGGAA